MFRIRREERLQPALCEAAAKGAFLKVGRCYRNGFHCFRAIRASWRREAQRNEVVAAAEAGELDPLTEYFAKAAIVDYMRPVGERLERNAAAAEQDGQRAIVATTSQVQIRHAEARARMGGHGGFGATKGPGGGLGQGSSFSVQIVFASMGTVETFSTRDTHEIIDGQAYTPDKNSCDVPDTSV
jgi:hypothetical protein